MSTKTPEEAEEKWFEENYEDFPGEYLKADKQQGAILEIGAHELRQLVKKAFLAGDSSGKADAEKRIWEAK